MNETIVTIRKLGETLLTLADQLEKADLAPMVETVSEETAPAEPAPAIKLEDVRAVLADISRNGKTAEMKALLSKFGVSKLSDLDPGKYGDLLAEAEVIRNA